MTPINGGSVDVSVAPSGVQYTEDTANGITTYEIAIPWGYIDPYEHQYSVYLAKDPTGAIGREYGMSAVVYNADGNSGGAYHNAALCWGSGILAVQQDLFTQTCGGSNRVVLTGDVVEPGNFMYDRGYAPENPPVLYPRTIDESTRIILDYENESDMDILGYNCGGEWIEEENGNRAARWDLDEDSDSYLNENVYLYPVEPGTLDPYLRDDGSYTVELDVKVTETEQFENGSGTSAFGFVFGGADGFDFRCEYDFDFGLFVIVDNRTGKTLAAEQAEFALNEWHHVVFQYFKDNCEIRLYFDPIMEYGRVSYHAYPVFKMSYRYFDDPTDGGSPIIIRRMNCQTLLDNVQIYNFVDYTGYLPSFPPSEEEPHAALPASGEEPASPAPDEEPAVDSPVSADGSASSEKTADPGKTSRPEKTAQPAKTAQTGRAAQTGDPLTTYVAAALIAALVMTGCGFDLYRRRKAANGDK